MKEFEEQRKEDEQRRKEVEERWRQQPEKELEEWKRRISRNEEEGAGPRPCWAASGAMSSSGTER
eukprot:11879939-Alexandrium_andersonii.AAC.1